MKTISLNELHQVSGGTYWSDYRKIDPAEWLEAGMIGGTVGTAVFTLAMFTANPIGFPTAFLTGFGIAACARAAGNLITFYDFSYDKPNTNNTYY